MECEEACQCGIAWLGSYASIVPEGKTGPIERGAGAEVSSYNTRGAEGTLQVAG